MLIDTHTAPGSPGQRFRDALARSKPLPIVGVMNPFCALLAERAGHQAIYLAGGGMATYSHGLPDLALTTMTEVLQDVRRITDACDLPLMVDVDTGFGGLFNIARLVKGLIKDGAASLHIEDQVQLKRCGHRPNKALVGTEEMLDRIKSCVDTRTDEAFFIVARTDSLANEGLDAAIEYLVLALRPDLMMPLDRYRRDLSESLARIKATPRQPGIKDIRLPSGRAHAQRAISLRDGIEIDEEIFIALRSWSERR